MTNAHVPEALTVIIDIFAIGDSQFLRILAMLILAIIAGMILDPLIPVLVPIILPTLLAFDVDLLHFGVLMVIAVVIGQVTPPLAIALIIAGRIANVDLHCERGPDGGAAGQHAVLLRHHRVYARRHRPAGDCDVAARTGARLNGSGHRGGDDVPALPPPEPLRAQWSTWRIANPVPGCRQQFRGQADSA